MRLSTTLVAVMLGVCRFAAAQGDSPPTLDPTPPAPPPAPPSPPSPPSPPPAPPPMMHHDEPAQEEGRPEGTAFGIGIGYALPTSLETPNTASLRLRFASGLTLEPRVALANSSTTMQSTGAMDMTDSTSELLLEGALRKAFIKRGRYEFEGIGGARIDVTKNDPQGDNNTRTTTDIGLFWGIGVGAWITSHWQFTFSIENPLISFTSTKQETGAGTSTTNSTTNIGVTFNPNVVMMIHLYN